MQIPKGEKLIGYLLSFGLLLIILSFGLAQTGMVPKHTTGTSILNLIFYMGIGISSVNLGLLISGSIRQVKKKDQFATKDPYADFESERK